MDEKPPHLGGGEDRCHDDIGSLNYMIQAHSVKSMVDIGCGWGCQVQHALERGLNAYGIDGDRWLSGQHWGDLPIICHDYVKGTVETEPVDLIWSVEFLEHVEEKYMDNYMYSFQKGKLVVCTHAPPGKNGYHHVNCKSKEYWIDKFSNYGFTYLEKETKAVKKASTMIRNFIRENGLVFQNEY